MEPKYIRFDWAMKRLLRDKADFVVFEGLVKSLLGRDIKIIRFLESEANQQDEFDKYNRVDMLAETDGGELIIVEIQNSRELVYFHRMLYGVSKAITDYIHLGDDYGKVHKVYSINIVYFELGQGSDYVYHGRTVFTGLHKPDDTLRLSDAQLKKFFGIEKGSGETREAGVIFPEYYILRVEDFDNVARTPLDEWMRFLKTAEISDNTAAPGLAEARETLRVDSLPPDARASYRKHLDAVAFQRSAFDTERYEGMMEGMEIGRKEKATDMAITMLRDGEPPEKVARYTGLTLDEIAQLSKQ